jgi:hypothetical protein
MSAVGLTIENNGCLHVLASETDLFGNRPDLTAVRVVRVIPVVCIVGARMVPILQLPRVPVIVAAVNVLNYRRRRRGCNSGLRLLATRQTQCHQGNGGKKRVRVWLHVAVLFSVAITTSRCVAVFTSPFEPCVPK